MEQTPPILEFFDDEPVISPLTMQDKPVILAPQIKTAICTFLCENIDRSILEPILANSHLLFYVYGRTGKIPVFQYKDECLIVLMTVGSPVAVAVVEYLKCIGIENIIAYGTAGLLDERVPDTACVLIEKAIRDDGASYHYLPASVYVETDRHLTDWLEHFLCNRQMQVVRGITWTTDAMFRETAAQVARRRQQGAVTVEMECAGFAAACLRLKMRFAEFVFFSDTLVDVKNWHMFGDEEQHNERRSLKVVLLQSLLNAVRKIDLPN